MLTPQQYQQKQNTRLKASLSDMTDGVNRVTTSPTSQAAAKKDKMLARLTAAVQSGKWAAGLNAVSLDDWKTAMTSKGVQRVSAGIDAAAQKVTDFASQLLPAISSAQQKIAAMPDLTLDDNINRSAAFIREMSKFKKK